MPKGGTMLVLLFIGLCFAAGVVGVLAWIHQDKEDQVAQDARTTEKLECAQMVSQLKSTIEGYKASADQAAAKAASAETIAIQLRENFQAVENKAQTAADLSHRALLQTAKPQTIKMEGSLKLERESPKTKAEPRRAP